MRSISLPLFLLAVAASPISAEVNLADAEKKYKRVCRACHGPKAQGAASFPKLADKPEEYLVTRLEQYRAGERIGPNTALMAPNAAGLSDDEIAGLAAFIVTFAK